MKLKLAIRILALTLLVELPFAALCDGPNPWRSNLAAAKAEARQTGKALVAFCTQANCGPCQRMESDVWPRMGKDLVDVVAVKIQPGAEMSSLGVNGTPTTIIWAADGTEKARYVGYIDRVTLAFKLQDLTTVVASGKVPADLVAASVRIQAKLDAKSFASGSGTVIAAKPDKNGHEYSYILTCRHVAEHGGPFDILFSNGYAAKAELLAQADNADLACLYIGQSAAYVNVAADLPPRGQSVWQVGYPHAVAVPVQRSGTFQGQGGRVSKGLGQPGWFNSFVFKVGSDQGDSGSGVFTQSHELCAVIWGHDETVGVDDVWQFLDEQCKVIGLARRKSAPSPIVAKPGPTPAKPSLPPAVPPEPYRPVVIGSDPLGEKLDKLSGRLDSLDKWKEDIATLIGSYKPVPGRDGAKGEAGLMGLAGPAGPMGPQGPAGRDADVAKFQAQLDAMKAKVDRQQAILEALKGSIHVKVSQ